MKATTSVQPRTGLASVIIILMSRSDRLITLTVCMYVCVCFDIDGLLWLPRTTRSTVHVAK